eukprot:3853122-Prymnesium_polylepis.1
MRAVRHDHRGAAEDERHPHLCDRAVEGRWRLENKHVGLREVEEIVAPAEAVPHARARHDAALWLARRPRGVHHVHHVGRVPGGCAIRLRHLPRVPLRLRLERLRREVAAPRIDDAAILGHGDDGALPLVAEHCHDLSLRTCVAHDAAHFGLDHDIRQPLARPSRVKRDERGARLEGGKLAQWQSRAALQDETGREDSAQP